MDSARQDGRKNAECRCGIATLHKESKALAAWGSPGWLAKVLWYLFGEDQLPGMGLAQQIKLAVMLDDHASLVPQQAFTVDPTIGARWGRCCVCVFGRCRVVIRT